MEHDQQQANGLERLQATAMERSAEYALGTAGGKGVSAVAGGAFVDNSRKSFYKEFTRVVNASDVIIEVLDARDPAGCRCPDVERFIRKVGPSKKIILVLNKIDLVPKEVAEAWLKYLREELPAVAFKCSTQKQASNLGRTTRQSKQTADGSLKGAECLGAETLLQLLKNYARSANIKTSITVGVVGLPNVGKSSLINSLKRTRVTQVGNTPGVTKSVQEVHLDKNVTLLDSPGVVFADASADGAAAAALRNAVKVEQLDDPLTPVAEIIRRCPAKQLMTLYKVSAFADADEFLQLVAQARGKLKRGGSVDVGAAAKIVLQDWNDGRIPYFTMPPKRHSEVLGSAAVVNEWGKEFNADEVFANESSAVIATLASMEDPSLAFFQTDTAGDVHVALDEMEAEEATAGAMEDNEGDVMEDDEAPAAVPIASKRGNASTQQNVELYAQGGQFNPHAARAEKKRRKKTKDEGMEDDEDEDSDYDFAADWDDAEDGNAFAQLAGGSEEEGIEEEEDDDSDEEME